MIYESDYYVGSDLNGDSLSHHGVPHQRWGVKNGPPYPIQKGHEVKYNLGKMTPKTKAGLQKAGKIAGEKVTNAAKTVVKKVSSSFQKWKESKKADLVIKDTNSKLVKNWQKKQLRISDMTNQELQQRIDRKKLEETYKHALRGDFSDPKTWKSGKNGKAAADGILRRVGNASVEGLAKGLTSRIEYGLTSRAKGKADRREARRNATSKFITNAIDSATDAHKERSEYNWERRNERWQANKERKERQRYDDGAMDPVMGWQSGPSRNYSRAGIGGSTGKPTGTYVWLNPDEYGFR